MGGDGNLFLTFSFGAASSASDAPDPAIWKSVKLEWINGAGGSKVDFHFFIVSERGEF